MILNVERKLKNCIKSDVDDLILLLQRNYDRHVKITIDNIDDIQSRIIIQDIVCKFTVTDIDSRKTSKFELTYMVDTNNCEIEYYDDLDEVASELDFLLEDSIDSSTSIKSMITRRKIKSNESLNKFSYVKGAEGDEDFDEFQDDDPGFESGEFMFDDEEPLDDTLDEMSDQLEDMQDQLDDVQEDDPSIQMDNNITDHYIVECDKCKGVFISSIKESDADIEKVSGRCPLCGKDSDQYLKWIIRDANERSDQ